jgi:hypothetical protein
MSKEVKWLCSPAHQDSFDVEATPSGRRWRLTDRTEKKTSREGKGGVNASLLIQDGYDVREDHPEEATSPARRWTSRGMSA